MTTDRRDGKPRVYKQEDPLDGLRGSVRAATVPSLCSSRNRDLVVVAKRSLKLVSCTGLSYEYTSPNCAALGAMWA